MSHTPGPWRAMPEHGRIVLNGSAIYGVADITGDYANWNPDDLTLMAAAPELLSVCKLLYQCMGEVIEDQNEVAFSDLRLAIMKAEGET